MGQARRNFGAAWGAILLALAAAPAVAQEPFPTLSKMRLRDRLAAPEAELAAWQGFAARALADPATPLADQAEIRLGLAIAQLYAKHFAAGLADLEAARALAAALPAPPPFAAELDAYGALLLTELDRLPEAEAMAEAALARASAPRDVALAHNAIAGIAFARNDLARAEAHYCAARDAGLAAPAPDYAMVVNDAASCGVVKYYLERGDTLAAMRVASDLAHAHLPPDHPKMGNVLNSAYAVLLRYGRYGEAEPLIRRHLALERALHSRDVDDIYDPLSMLARAQELRGNFAEAEELFRAAADMAARMAGAGQPDRPGIARGNLARAIARQGRLAEAEAEARAGLARLTADLAPGDANIGNGQVQLADHLERLGRREEALELAEAGLALLGAALPPEHSEVLQARLIRARILAGMGRHAEALEAARAAAAVFRGQLFDLATSETEHVTLSRVLPHAFGDYLEVALAAGDDGAAVEAGQLLLLSDLAVANARIAAASVARDAGLEAGVAGLEQARARIAELDGALARALADGSGDAAALAARLAEARRAAAGAEAALLASYPAYADLARPRLAALEQLQAGLNEGELLVLPIALPTRAVTLAIGRDGVTIGSTAANPQAVQALAARVRESAQAPGTFDLAAAAELFALVFPLETRTALAGARQLLFPASGYLARLSPALLLTAPAARLEEAPWLVRSHALTILADPAAPRGTAGPLAPRGFLGVGAPAGLPPALAEAQTRGGPQLPPLPQARAELEQLAAALAAPDPLLLTDAAATEPALAAQDLARFDVIAFATHGLVGGEVPGLAEPALLLSPADGSDGLFTASEIARLRLAAQWVILSACNTAAGEDAGAPGYSGLARAFASAGAKSLLISHWRVRDDAAAFLSVETMRRAAAGAPRAEALRAAQLALLDGQSGLPGAAHPAVWAPFVILGE